MSRLTMIYLSVCLLGCAADPVKPLTQVSVPVSVPCLAEEPVEPLYLFKDLPAPTSAEQEAEQIRVLWNDREAAISYGRAWVTATTKCRALKQKTQR